MGWFRRFAADRRGSTAVMFALAIVPQVGAAAVAVDFTRASQVRADLQAAADAAAIAALQGKNVEKGELDGGRVLKSNTALALGRTESLRHGFTWEGKNTVEVTATVEVKGQFGQVLPTDSTITVRAKATRETGETAQVTVTPVFNCPYNDSKMSVYLLEKKGNETEKRFLYDNTTDKPGPLTVAVNPKAKIEFMLVTEKGTRRTSSSGASRIEGVSQDKPAYFEQLGKDCDKGTITQGWEDPFDSAPYANFLRVRYDVSCAKKSEIAGNVRLIR